jgi:hypothetical protein
MPDGRQLTWQHRVRRLICEHPKFWREFVAGKYPSVLAARGRPGFPHLSGEWVSKIEISQSGRPLRHALELAAALGVTCEAFTGTGELVAKLARRGRGRPKGK